MLPSLMNELMNEREGNDWILVRVNPTSEISTISTSVHPLGAVVMTRKDSSTAQMCELYSDQSVPRDDIAPEETSHVCTAKAAWSWESMVQIDRPFDDHTNEILLALHFISLATPPV